MRHALSLKAEFLTVVLLGWQPDSLRVAHYPEQIGLEARIKMLGSCGSFLDGWLRPCPNPHPQTDTNTVHISCTDHTYWQKLSVCTSARWGSLCRHVPRQWREIRAQLSEWRALKWVSAAMQEQGCVVFVRLLTSCLMVSVSLVWFHRSTLLASLWPRISWFMLSLPTLCLMVCLQGSLWHV